MLSLTQVESDVMGPRNIPTNIFAADIREPVGRHGTSGIA